MGSNRTNQEIAIYTAQVIQELNDYLNDLVSSGEPDDARANKIDYWIENWTNYLKREKKFNPRGIPALKRGSIIYADFGFNVGQEYGGLHYAIVLNHQDSRNNSLLHVLPLTSVKETTDLQKLRYFQLHLGDEVYQLLLKKILKHRDEILELKHRIKQDYSQYTIQSDEVKDILNSTQKAIAKLRTKEKDATDDFYAQSEELQVLTENLEYLKSNVKKLETLGIQLNKSLNAVDDKLEYLRRLKNKITNMKEGSIALLNQVTTISKIRLYDPKNKNSILTDIVLSSATMQKIDIALKNIF